MDDIINTSGLNVSLIGKPGKIGITTGKTKKFGANHLVEVKFGPSEVVFHPVAILQIVEEDDTASAIQRKSFGNCQDLRKVLIYHKISGELTNVFYSMEVGNTDFYSHQFKPVLKFIESHVNRILIADEVGLGKTIEAVYIWKELQARQSARRMLIVCPAMLREKWKDELRERFGIRSQIVGAKELFQELEEMISMNDQGRSFVYIASLEGLRPPADYQEEQRQNSRARLGWLLENNSFGTGTALFDLAVFDEAHYLRNPATSSNRLGRLVRDAAQNMVFLTATPIQTSSENLFQIMKLIDPDQFYDSRVFSFQTELNTALVRLSTLLKQQGPDANSIKEILEEIRKDETEGHSQLVEHIERRFGDQSLEDVVRDHEKTVALSRIIDSNQLLNRYMNRTRKRDVIEKRVIRTAETMSVQYTSAEVLLYKTYTELIQRKAKAEGVMVPFVLISRQRQMASSLVAALRGWEKSGLAEQYREYLWEDFGELTSDSSTNTIVESFDAGFLDSIDINELEECDSKYASLSTGIQGIIREYGQEKIIIFSYFRNTLSYLERRLQCDGYTTFLIQGGMGNDKFEVIEHFRDHPGTSILLSSEVGSEGIDLQFCRILINYDLPWNPMRVEQRIGRIDRLGQESKRINILNFTNFDTIEDQILDRLYKRIEVFKSSIGDLEDILGSLQSELRLIAYSPDLSDEEKNNQANQAMNARFQNKMNEQLLEDNALNLLGFSDYLINTINDTKKNNRWINGRDLIVFIKDFFKNNYTETIIDEDAAAPMVLHILLTPQAKADLDGFIQRTKPMALSNLHRSPKPISCVFNQKAINTRSSHIGYEFIDTSHPLIHWIKEEYQNQSSSLYPYSAVQVAQEDTEDIEPGLYVYIVQKWDFKGMTNRSVLSYALMRIVDSHRFDQLKAEKIINDASNFGKDILNHDLYITDTKRLEAALETLSDELTASMNEQYEEMQLENTLFCTRQLSSAERLYQRKTTVLSERLSKFASSDDPHKKKVIPAIKGLIAKEDTALEKKRRLIRSNETITPSLKDLSSGYIVVVAEGA